MPKPEAKAVTICSECGAPLTFLPGTSQVRCDHCAAGMAVAQGSQLVRLDCPRCRGNFYYIDGSLSATCPYCGVGLLALTQDRVLRYVALPEDKPADAPAAAELVLLPFWQLSGLVFGYDIGSKVEIVQETPSSSTEAKSGNQSLPATRRQDSGPQKLFRGRVVNVSLPDPAALAYGVTSLRLRAAVFPLEPFKADHERLGQIVPPVADAATTRDDLRARAMSLGSVGDGLSRLDAQRQELVAETQSLLYYPFWIARSAAGEARAWDAVSGQPERLTPPVQAQAQAQAAGGLFDELALIERECPHCASPLPPGNHSRVLPCASCNSFWSVTATGLQPFTARFARPVAPGAPSVWLPFWRVEVAVSYAGRHAQTVGELRTALGVLRPPGELPAAAPDAALAYYAPAYGAMRAPRLDFAARDMTRLQPQLEPGPAASGEVFTCFLGPDDACQLGYVTWIALLPGVVVPRLRSLRIASKSPELWYVPFTDSGRELCNMLTGFRYDWSSFRGVRH